MRASEKSELPFKQRAEELAKIQALLTEINGTKALWFSDTPQRTPVRIELKDDDTQITAELVQQ